MVTWTTKLLDEIAVGDRATLEHVVAEGALAYLAAAESAGVVPGTRVPIARTSRADNARSREASTAIMARIAHARRSGTEDRA
jgi:hypothetical protein